MSRAVHFLSYARKQNPAQLRSSEKGSSYRYGYYRMKLYNSRRTKAMCRPNDVRLIILDGADQFPFGLSQFTTLTKNVNGHAIKGRFNEVLERCAIKSRL